MSSALRAIETIYAGHRFRSRLEARWAVFFDTLGVRWLYEPEGFETSHGRYLPDFLLPDIGNGGTWFEVKPDGANVIDERWFDVAIGTNRRLVVAAGLPSVVEVRDNGSGTHENGHQFYVVGSVDGHPWEDWDYAWCICRTCGRLGIEFRGRGERICDHTTSDRGESGDDVAILEAYAAARMARFEFGQVGA